MIRLILKEDHYSWLQIVEPNTVNTSPRNNNKPNTPLSLLPSASVAAIDPPGDPMDCLLSGPSQPPNGGRKREGAWELSILLRSPAVAIVFTSFII
jgi:hypothetical protein